MAEELDAAPSVDLPPFSFLKKPIKSVFATSVISSTLNKSFPDKKPALKPTLNNINYDEQIRAPRMSLASHYTYKPESPRPFTDRKSLTLSRSTSHELVIVLAQQKSEPSDIESETGAINAEQTSQYIPATADLNQPTRRNLEQLKPRLGLITSAILTYTTNNYFEQPHKFVPRSETHGHILKPNQSVTRSRNASEDQGQNGHDVPSHRNLDVGSDILDSTVLLDRLKLLRAIDNLNSNTTTAERMEFAKNVHQFGGRMRSSTMSAKGPGVQQVYNLKKPLCTPAVLRPISKDDDEEMDEVDRGLELESLTPMVLMTNCPFQVPESSDECSQQEPTHEHWQPNNSTDHCMKCFEVFGNFFSPQKKRRHHCRFCGMLFCDDCLYKRKEMHYFKMALPEDNDLVTASGDHVSAASRRAYSGSSNTSPTASTISSSLLEETVSGVMIDSKARLVVPLFQNLSREGANTLLLQSRFKQCKICKTCGHNYRRLVTTMNQRLRNSDDFAALYVFIENPYLATSLSAPSVLHAPMSRREENPRAPERRASSLATNVQSDWTWSSF